MQRIRLGTYITYYILYNNTFLLKPTKFEINSLTSVVWG